MDDLIIYKLQEIEEERPVKIVMAVESGSRAWGFERPQSDWDVRFIYVRDRLAYLSPFVDQRRDTMGPYVDGDLDLVGWDLRKACQLLAKSNPNLLEWLRSQTVYMNRDRFIDKMYATAEQVFNPVPAFYHYSSIAKNAIDKADATGKKVFKRQLYAIRCLCAALYVMNHGKIPPMRMADLIAAELPADLLPEITEKVALRRSGWDEDKSRFSEDVERWICQMIQELRAVFPSEPTPQQKYIIEGFFAQQVNIYG